ncbi:MAG: hypothetical protein ACREJM_12875, partial [Candidatus Saccharimonadales bacterium]
FKGWRGTWSGLMTGLREMGRRASLLLAAGLALSCLLFAQRYVVNLARYHSPIPSCDKVLSTERCMAYGPWARDYHNQMTKAGNSGNPGIFVADWFYGVWFRMVFAVAGPGADYQTRGPLLIPALGSIAFAGAGLVLIAAYGRRIFRIYDTRVLTLLSWAVVAYVAALCLDNFSAYVRTGQPVAINGRYLFPILLPVLLLAALSAGEFCRRRPSWVKPALAGAAVICLLWGGGAMTYVLRSNDGWYWPDAGPVNGINHTIQNTLGPVTPGYRNLTEFMGTHGT